MIMSGSLLPKSLGAQITNCVFALPIEALKKLTSSYCRPGSFRKVSDKRRYRVSAMVIPNDVLFRTAMAIAFKWNLIVRQTSEFRSQNSERKAENCDVHVLP
jgi:hypothetical protein